MRKYRVIGVGWGYGKMSIPESSYAACKQSSIAFAVFMVIEPRQMLGVGGGGDKSGSNYLVKWQSALKLSFPC